MNIADQLEQVGLFLAGDGLVVVLEKTAGTTMAAVEMLSVAGKETSHKR
jgi:hypothetical protein